MDDRNSPEAGGFRGSSVAPGEKVTGQIVEYIQYAKEKGGSMPLGPSTTDDCINCKLCAKKCPNGVISLENPKELAKDPTECLRCHRCVTICPKHAKYFAGEGYKAMVDRCIAGFAKPDKENKYFM